MAPSGAPPDCLLVECSAMVSQPSLALQTVQLRCRAEAALSACAMLRRCQWHITLHSAAASACTPEHRQTAWTVGSSTSSGSCKPSRICTAHATHSGRLADSRGSCHDVCVHDAKLFGVAGNPQEVHAPRHAARLAGSNSSSRNGKSQRSMAVVPACARAAGALQKDGRQLAVQINPWLRRLPKRKAAAQQHSCWAAAGKFTHCSLGVSVVPGNHVPQHHEQRDGLQW